MKPTWKVKYTWFLAMVMVIIISIVVDFWILDGVGEHGEFWWSHIHGFFALLGFIGCVAIIVIAKWLGKYLLQRREDYYD